MLVRASLRAGTSFHGIFNGKFARLAAVFTARESNFPKFHENFLGLTQCSLALELDYCNTFKKKILF